VAEAKAAVFAYHDVGVRCLRVLLDAGVDVALVVTHRDDARENVFFGSVAELASRNALPLLLDPAEEEIAARLAQIEPDFIFSFYYRRMLPLSILRLAKRGAFNMHGSLLPKYRGRAPVNWAVLKGETETGATLHEMVEKPDAGRIVDQESVPIGPDELAVEVFGKVTDAAETILRRCIGPLLSGTAQLKMQNLSSGSYFGGRKPEDGRIDWSRPAKEIHDLVRAVAPPYPGAFCEFEGRLLKVFRTRLQPGTNARSGKAGPYRENGEWFAAGGDGKVLRLLEIELQE
jgi:methionyl-tRNA formyltransferase